MSILIPVLGWGVFALVCHAAGAGGWGSFFGTVALAQAVAGIVLR